MDIPPRSGKVPELDKFDSTFFGIHPKLAEFMDPRQRILCETVYECIIDAGYNPQELRGSNTGELPHLPFFEPYRVTVTCFRCVCGHGHVQ